MSNNINGNVYSGAPAPSPAEAALINSNSNENREDATRIRIDSELHHPLLTIPLLQVDNQNQIEHRSSTSIDMEAPSSNGHVSSETSSLNGNSGRSMQRNFLSLFNEARTQLGRQTSYPGTSTMSQQHQQQQPAQFQFGSRARAENFVSPQGNNFMHTNSSRNSSRNNSQNNSGGRVSMPQPPTVGGAVPQSRHGIRSWRMNLNDVLSFSSAPSTEALRSLITHSGGFRYTPLSNDNATNTGDNIHLLLQNQQQEQDIQSSATTSSGFRASAPTLRSNSLREDITFGGGSGGMPQSVSMSAAAEASNTPNEFSSSAFYNNSTTASSSITSRASINDVNATRHHHNTITPATITPTNGSNNRGGVPPEAAANNVANIAAAAADMDEDNNVISDMFVKVLGHFVRYLPFIGILFIKFIHDHLLGILDLVLLHGIMYQVNKSLREQIAKFSQKSYGVLLRYFGLVAFVVAYRFVIAASYPDPFGLLIGPPSESVTIAITSITKNGGSGVEATTSPPASASVVLSQYLSQLTAKPQPSVTTTDPLGNTVTISKAISLGVLLYYVAVNDLILKLITILIKITITMMPTRVIRHKPRARMYVLVEYISQFYRALAPVHQWLIFLFESYSGLEVISGVLFSSFYMGAKGFDFIERGKSLRKAVINFVRNMDYERKPTKDELDAAGTLCPICHDVFSMPVVLECSHIFCDDCVSTWFKREQTCPMCRAKVSEDPTWQDGGTTFFYQLC